MDRVSCVSGFVESREIKNCIDCALIDIHFLHINKCLSFKVTQAIRIDAIPIAFRDNFFLGFFIPEIHPNLHILYRHWNFVSSNIIDCGCVFIIVNINSVT